MTQNTHWLEQDPSSSPHTPRSGRPASPVPGELGPRRRLLAVAPTVLRFSPPHHVCLPTRGRGEGRRDRARSPPGTDPSGRVHHFSQNPAASSSRDTWKCSRWPTPGCPSRVLSLRRKGAASWCRCRRAGRFPGSSPACRRGLLTVSTRGGEKACRFSALLLGSRWSVGPEPSPMTAFDLNYLRKGPISRDSHTGGWASTCEFWGDPFSP